MERRCRGLRSCSWGKVCQTFHAETLKVFLLYLALHRVNNERFVTSVLSHVVENTQRRHSGVCIQLIVLYSTLCKPYNHNPLNSLLLCVLSVLCWKADLHFKSLNRLNFFFFFKVLLQLTFRSLSQQMSVAQNYQHGQLSACHLLSQYAGTWFCLDNGRQAAASERTHTHIADSHCKSILSLSSWVVALEDQN